MAWSRSATPTARAVEGKTRDRNQAAAERVRRGSQEMLERTGKAGLQVGRSLHQQVLAGGERTRSLADLLHGTWLGHPLHPVLTDITIGAWTFGAIFDLMGALTGDRATERTADRLTAIGTASAVPTALAGITDYSTLPKGAANTGTSHALLNGASLALYGLSLLDRRRGRRRRGHLLAAAGLAANMYSAWLGGHLVYREKVGVDHSERFSGPREWIGVLNAQELASGQAKRVKYEGGSVMVYREGDAVYAIGAVCSHAGGPLEEGKIRGCYVECPWHQSVFDLRDGSIRHGPATTPQPGFHARIRDGRIEVRLAEVPAGDD